MARQQGEAERAFATASDLALSPRQWIEVESNCGGSFSIPNANPEAAEAFAAVLDRQPQHIAARQGLGVALTDRPGLSPMQERLPPFR
jgi:hypothetical protein